MRPLFTAAAAAILATAATTSGAGAEERTLRGVSAFAAGTAFAQPYEAFVDGLNENGKGVLQIQSMGGPEAMPPFEVGNALQSGVVDIAYVTGAFYTNIIPEADAFKLSQNTIQQQRANGCYDLIDALHQDKMNAHYLARFGDNIPFHLYLTKKIDKPDLTGLTIRTTPVYQAFFQSLGANLVRTAPGEVYTALERGAIDGYGWPTQGVLDLGWDEQTKFRVDPGFYQVEVNVLVNLDVWNSLTDEQKALLEQGAAQLEAKNEENVARNKAEIVKQGEAGIEEITFSQEENEAWLQAAQDTGWAAISAIDETFATKLRDCYGGR